MYQKKGGGGEQRPVVNLKPLNRDIPYEHFKMEGIHMLKDLLKKGDYLVKIDLKDAYLTVPIWHKHQKYLRFLWKDNMWEFACLPFGLASAPRVFTKLLKPVVAVLRQMGLRIIIYLDDILIMSKSYDLALTHASTALNLLEGLGFVVNYEKSCLEPSQIIEFLGFEINSQTLTILLPRDKIRKIRKKCLDLLDNPNTSVRELSKFLGLLTSSIQAIFPAPLHYRNLQFAKNQALRQSQSYETIVHLSYQAVQEIQWWRDHLIAWNGRAILRQPIQLTIETDASTKGWGAHCQGISTGGRWSPEEKELHINCLEFLAGSFAVKTFAKGMGKVHILLLMDSVSAVSYINKLGGTHSFVLNSLAHDLWTWCHVNLTAQHIPGVTNTLADWESRVFQDSSDWKLNPQVFAAINKLWGPQGIDLFASRLTRQLPNFVSWKPDPEALGTDAFALDWNQGKGYAFPPFSLIGRCLRQVQVQQVAELVIVTSLASTSMVPFTSGTLHRLPSSASTGPLPFDEGSGSTPTRPSPLSWVACFHRSFETAQISPEVREILLSAWRPNTTKSYASAWNKWNSWCVEHHCDPISPPLPAVLNFLCCQFLAGHAYRSLNVYRSALSAILPQVDAQKVGSHPLVSQFLRGVFQLRPPLPGYTETWDVAKVTCL